MTDVQTNFERDSERNIDRDKKRRFGRMNLLVISAQVMAWGSIITVLHQDISLWIKAPILLLFCLMMQGVFSFMHECFHDHGHPNARINWALGWLASTIFGTTYTLFRINHLGHHVRNRTRAELVDYILPGESALRKTVLYYLGIFGGIWLGGFIGALMLPFLPYKVTRSLASQEEDITFSSAFNDFTKRDWNFMRLELALGVAFWITVIVLLGWDWHVLLVIYAAFAFSWSLLQWVYHVRTPIDVVEGAYNLHVPTPLRWLFLNFNYNLSHHRDSSHHWQELYAVSNQDEMQPLLYRLIRIFLPPEPLPDDPGSIRKTYF